MNSPSTSLYAHFPFCETKCHYCDFYSLGREKTRPGDPDRFESALIREIELRGQEGSFLTPLKTLFFGGGTPSMTPPESMGRITKTLFQYATLNPGAEWTLEANPSSIDQNRFTRFRELGINRISMGVQSLKDTQLKTLGRVHSESDALRALEAVFAAGFSNVSTDLLCGVPGQTLADLDSHITRLTAFPITHLSIYLLTLPPHHALYPELPDENEQLEHLLFIDERMRGLGFRHYEISNFARPGFEAKHNLVYWTGDSYLGLGPSAHSFSALTRSRFKNHSSLHRYSAELLERGALPVEWTETLTPDQLELEKWMLALRLDLGFPKSWLERESQRMKSSFFIEQGWLEPHPEDSTRLRATSRGFALNDALIKGLV